MSEERERGDELRFHFLSKDNFISSYFSRSTVINSIITDQTDPANESGSSPARGSTSSSQPTTSSHISYPKNHNFHFDHNAAATASAAAPAGRPAGPFRQAARAVSSPRSERSPARGKMKLLTGGEITGARFFSTNRRLQSEALMKKRSLALFFSNRHFFHNVIFVLIFAGYDSESELFNPPTVQQRSPITAWLNNSSRISPNGHSIEIKFNLRRRYDLMLRFARLPPFMSPFLCYDLDD